MMSRENIARTASSPDSPATGFPMEDNDAPLRILHISTYDVRGGAARAAHRLHRGLIELGQRSQMLVSRRYSRDDSVISWQRPLSPMRRVQRRIRREAARRSFRPYRESRPPGSELFSLDQVVRGRSLARHLPDCDLINLHWVSGFVDYVPFFSALRRDIPIVWTMHDMNALTGGCHYDGGCGRFAERCGSCPQLGSSRDEDLSRRIWERKRKALRWPPQLDLQLVADSRWLELQCRRSSLLEGFPVRTIHYGLDMSVFSPRDQAFSRSIFNLPAGVPIVLFIADSVSNRRKGMDVLLEALEGIDAPADALLVSAGGGQCVVNGRLRCIHLGPVEEDLLLSALYSAADLFVIPSREEAFGQTALESMACGTPVVGSDVGGIPEIVVPGRTGVLTPPGDPGALREAILGLLLDPERRRRLAAGCRETVYHHHALTTQASEYLRLYRELTARKTAETSL